MRKLLIIILAMLALAVLVTIAGESGSGYVLIAAGDTTIELTLVLAIALMAVFYLLLMLTTATLRKIFGARKGVRGWALNRRKQRGLNRTTQGLIAFVEGRWDFARKSLAKAASQSSTPLVNYLFAARASSELGDAKAVDDYLRHAALSTSGADVAIGLTQAELQMSNGQYEQALATLLRARKDANHHPVVLRLLSQVYRQLGDWQALLSLVPGLRKYKVLDEPLIVELETSACRELLTRAANESAESLMNYWKQLPSPYRKEAVVVAAYAGRLLAKNLVDEAERVLRQQLHNRYDTTLVALYGKTRSAQPQKQKVFAEKLLKATPDDPVLLLALGRLCLANNMPEDAQIYFEKSYALETSADVCAALGQHFAGKGQLEKSNECYAAGLSSLVGQQIIPVSGATPVDNGSPAFEPVDDLKKLNVG